MSTVTEVEKLLKKRFGQADIGRMLGISRQRVHAISKGNWSYYKKYHDKYNKKRRLNTYEKN